MFTLVLQGTRQGHTESVGTAAEQTQHTHRHSSAEKAVKIIIITVQLNYSNKNITELCKLTHAMNQYVFRCQ